MGNIARAYFCGFPASLRSSEVTLSTEFIAQFATMDEFWGMYRESRVEKLMREDLAAWLTWYNKYLKMTPEQISPDYKALTEVFLTRNVHVHNSGKVNDVYLRMCSRHGLAPRQEKRGIKLPLTPSYLIRSIDNLHVTGMLVVYGMLKKLAAKIDEEEFANPWLNSNVYALLADERYEAMLALTHLLQDSDGYRGDTTQVNIWVARKETEGLESIRSEVEAWDTSGKARQFELVRLALLEDYEAADEIADEIFAGEHLSRADWNGWPVLKGLRSWVSADPDRGRYLLRESTAIGESADDSSVE